jgi:hypothetical protein
MLQLSDRKIWDIAGGTDKSTGLKIEMLANWSKARQSKFVCDGHPVAIRSGLS